MFQPKLPFLEYLGSKEGTEVGSWVRGSGRAVLAKKRPRSMAEANIQVAESDITDSRSENAHPEPNHRI